MLTFSSDQWVIVALIFILGLLIGAFLAAGGGRKWKHRYNAEVARRRELESEHAAREKDWREQDALRTAALRNPGPARETVMERDDRVVGRRVAEDPRDRNRDGYVDDPRDRNRDGYVDSTDAHSGRPAGFVDRVLGRDRDHDGVPDRDER